MTITLAKLTTPEQKADKIYLFDLIVIYHKLVY